MFDSPARSDGSDMERLAKDAPRNIFAAKYLASGTYVKTLAASRVPK